MDSDTGAKGKSRFDLSDVMTILDGGEPAKVDEAVEEPQEAAQPETKAPEVKISIVTLPEISASNAPAIAPEPKAPAIRAPEAVKVAESQNTQARANNALATKLLADMEQKNAEILKLKSDYMSLQYKLNEKDYRIREKDMNVQSLTGKVSDMQRQLEMQQRQHEDLQKQLESQQRRYDELQSQYGAVKAELDAINEDKAKVIARAEAHKLKKSDGMAGEEATAAPAEEDVASIFKRLTENKPEEPSQDAPQESVPSMDRPQPPRKLRTAKLYDL